MQLSSDHAHFYNRRGGNFLQKHHPPFLAATPLEVAVFGVN
jgi:hypothetical protein